MDSRAASSTPAGRSAFSASAPGSISRRAWSARWPGTASSSPSRLVRPAPEAMRVLYLYPRPRQQLWQEVRAGLGPDDGLHGLMQMPRHSIEADFDDNSRTAVWRIFH